MAPGGRREAVWTLIGLAVVIAAAVAFLRWQTADAGETDGGEAARPSSASSTGAPSIGAPGGGAPTSSPIAENAMTRVQLMADWLGHALRLLARDDIDVNAAHNKLKHGLAVRSRDDLRVAFIRQAPEDGTVPLSAFTSPDAVDLIDSVSLDYLSRPRARNGRKQGMEVTTLRLSPATLLAETWMMALTYGAMFHVAAARHFGARAEVQFPGYPDVPLGPTPDQLLRDSVIGIRHPVTTPPMEVRPTGDQDSLSTRGSCPSTSTTPPSSRPW